MVARRLISVRSRYASERCNGLAGFQALSELDANVNHPGSTVHEKGMIVQFILRVKRQRCDETAGVSCKLDDPWTIPEGSVCW